MPRARRSFRPDHPPYLDLVIHPRILPYSPENYPATIPDFATEEEVRDFYDTHDTSYYWDQGDVICDTRPDRHPDEPEMSIPAAEYYKNKPFDVPSGPQRNALISIRVYDETMDFIEQRAEVSELSPAELIRTWLFERLAADGYDVTIEDRDED